MRKRARSNSQTRSTWERRRLAGVLHRAARRSQERVGLKANTG